MPLVLLVEDESAIAETVMYALRAEGFDARHCLTGGEAIRNNRGQSTFFVPAMSRGFIPTPSCGQS